MQVPVHNFWCCSSILTVAYSIWYVVMLQSLISGFIYNLFVAYSKFLTIFHFELLTSICIKILLRIKNEIDKLNHLTKTMQYGCHYKPHVSQACTVPLDTIYKQFFTTSKAILKRRRSSRFSRALCLCKSLYRLPLHIENKQIKSCTHVAYLILAVRKLDAP